MGGALRVRCPARTPSVDYSQILDDLERATLGLGDVHVHPNVMLAGHHLGRTARALGDLGVVERLMSVPGSFDMKNTPPTPRTLAISPS